MAAQVLVEMKEVAKSYTLESGQGLKALEKMNLSIRDGQVVALLGPSGSGKSTCLRLLSGLDVPSQGQVLSRGKVLQGINMDTSMVFQSFALFPWETIFSNIEMALLPLGLEPAEVRTRVKRAVDLVGLEGFEEAYPRELSGGMKQRVGLARALAMERPVLLLDEALTSLDVLTAETLRNEILRIFKSKETPTKSMVVVTHNIEEAIFMADRILLMGINPGFVRAEVNVDLPHPRDPDTSAFQNMMTRVRTLITEAYIPDAPQVSTPAISKAGKLRVEALPGVNIMDVMGLVEVIDGEGGAVDVFDLSEKISKDFGTTLYITKAAELFGLIDTPKQKVVLLKAGNDFVAADINGKKKMLHDSFGSLSIVQNVAQLLRESETVRIPLEQLTEKILEWLPNENAETITDTLISWGRFAEYFGYNDDSKEIYLDVGQETR